MRRVLLAVLFAAVAAQLPAQHATMKAAPAAAAAAAPAAVNDLPVRKVVLYKNGVGYFEHAGSVNGNQRVAIDFTSAQLNDVLQSLTALDSSGGRVSAVSYNSTSPIEQQLSTLSLGLKDFPATISIYQALRGQRVEVTGAGDALAGRLVNIEFRKETGKDGETSEDHYYLIVETDSGALRTAELTDAVSVRMVDAGLQKQFASYLEVIASAQDQQARHLTLEDRGQGERQLQVSYISEVPVWKSTYRIVFPREATGNATVQGWAVVDNTVGVDWDNVQLSLVAGAPQSFIQPLSQPIYTHRPTVPIATEAQYAPTTQEAAESVTVQAGTMNNQLTAPLPALAPNLEMAQRALRSSNFGAAGMEGMGSGSGWNIGGGLVVGSGTAYGAATGANAGGGVYRASDAIEQGDVSTNAFDDFFEYAISQPVTIHKNESAMVPILQQDLPAEHVTLWSDRRATPLRAVWLDNQSKLTLDAGSFSIFENGEFAGEGLLDPIHPGEKRLLSYAVDQAVKVHGGRMIKSMTLHRVTFHKGVLVETTSEVTNNTYTVTNAGDEARTVIVEHTRKPNAELTSDVKPVETTATAYRFRVSVAPHQSQDLQVTERADITDTVRIGAVSNNRDFLIATGKYSPALEKQLQPAIDAETALMGLDRKITEVQQNLNGLSDDETRDRDNLTALKGNDAAKRFVDELNQDEDQIAAARKQQADLQKQRDAAQTQLDGIIATLSFDTDLDVAI